MDLESSTVFFTGGNAQGKTSLLEAIAMGCRLGSPRASKQAQMVRDGQAGCGVAIQVRERLYKSVYQDRKYQLAIDGQPTLRKDYLQLSPRVVWMENRDLELVRGSGEKRRRFIDVIGTQLYPAYGKALRDYTQALRSRNALLKDGRAAEKSFHIFTEILIENGEVLMQYRANLVEVLHPHITHAQQQISGRQETLSLHYHPSCQHLAVELRERSQKDILMRQTLTGPHRDDLALLIDKRPATDYASEGQQRTLAVALRLAQGALLLSQAAATEVVYLIDDVFGELDVGRKGALLKALPPQCQKILTTTQLHWDADGAQCLELREGGLIG